MSAPGPAEPVDSDESGSAAPASEPTSPVGVELFGRGLSIVPPVTVVVGVLFYFGWAREEAFLRELGQSPSVYDYSTTDYLLRSVASVFEPAVVLVVVGAALLLVHRLVRRALVSTRRGWVRPTGLALIAVGAALLLFCAVYYRSLYSWTKPWLDVSGPLALGAGALLIVYGSWLRSQADGGAAPGQPRWQRTLGAGMVMGIVALSLFWAFGNYAQVRGAQDELLIEDQVTHAALPSVVVYSERDLSLEPDVIVQRTPGIDAQFRYQYTCLFLLDHVAGSWYLVPQDFAENGRMIILREDPSLRFELILPDDTVQCPTAAASESA